jgi:hypothetical protein
MSTIELQFNETVTVKRLTQVAGTNKKIFTNHLTGVKAHFQPLDPQFSTDIDGGFGKEFLMFCETADISEGDRIIRSLDGVDKEYRVKGVERFSFMGESHMEVTVRIFETQ